MFARRFLSPWLGLPLVVTLFAPMPALAEDNQLPIGNHEGESGEVLAHACRADGWAMDPDQPTARVKVRVLVDGVEVASGVADQFREDLIVAGSSPDGFAGFGFDLWGSLTPNVRHVVRVQAQDPATLGWSDIEGTPRALRCVDHPGSSPFIGAWRATDVDGSRLTMTISGGDGTLRIGFHDDMASACLAEGASTTEYRAAGTGELTDLFVLVASLEGGGCGSQAIGFPAFWEILYDVPTDRLLTDGETIEWTRVGG